MTVSTPGLASNRFSAVTARGTAVTLAVAIVSATVIAVALDSVVAAIAHGAGVSGDFAPLHFASYAISTLIGVLAGSMVWTFVRARSAAPAKLLTRLVPTVVVLSFVPDILVGVSKNQAHTTWGAIAALMVMHLVVATTAVVVLTTLLPVRDTGSATIS